MQPPPRTLPASRAASLLLAVGALNLVITLFVALVAARAWNRLPELPLTVRVFDPSGAEAGVLDYRAPVELDDVASDGARAVARLADGSRIELHVPLEPFEQAAATSNLLRLFQLAAPLCVSVLFLAAGLRLRRLSRGT